jgi:hypothetical protein
MSKKGVNFPKPLSPIEIQTLIMKELVDLLDSKTNFGLAQHFVMILRPSNNNKKQIYEWTDSELLLVIQNYKKQINEDPIYER